MNGSKDNGWEPQYDTNDVLRGELKWATPIDLGPPPGSTPDKKPEQAAIFN